MSLSLSLTLCVGLDLSDWCMNSSLVYTESVSLSMAWGVFLDVAFCDGLDLSDIFFGADLDFLIWLVTV